MSLQNESSINEYLIEHQVRNEPLVYFTINEFPEKLGGTTKKYPLFFMVTKTSKSKMAKFYKELSCDFKLLEEKSLKYKG